MAVRPDGNKRVARSDEERAFHKPGERQQHKQACCGSDGAGELVDGQSGAHDATLSMAANAGELPGDDAKHVGLHPHQADLAGTMDFREEFIEFAVARQVLRSTIDAVLRLTLIGGGGVRISI